MCLWVCVCKVNQYLYTFRNLKFMKLKEELSISSLVELLSNSSLVFFLDVGNLYLPVKGLFEVNPIKRIAF